MAGQRKGSTIAGDEGAGRPSGRGGPRARLARTRLRLGYLARHRCDALRSALQREAADLTRRELGGFPARVRRAAAATVEEVDADITAALAGLAALAAAPAPAAPGCPAPALPAPPAPRRLERRLADLLGAGFGVGVALALTRSLAGLAGTTPAGQLAGLAAGLAAAAWLVRARGVLQRRAMLERWVGEVAAALRSAALQRVATRMLAAETQLVAASAERTRPLHPARVGHDNLY